MKALATSWLGKEFGLRSTQHCKFVAINWPWISESAWMFKPFYSCKIGECSRAKHTCLATYSTLKSMATIFIILWEYFLLSFYFKAKRLSILVQMSNVQLFGCSLFEKSHNHSESWERIGYTWKSNLFQGSCEEVKLVLCMNKQPSQTDSSLDALTEEPFSFSIFHTAFSRS